MAAIESTSMEPLLMVLLPAPPAPNDCGCRRGTTALLIACMYTFCMHHVKTAASFTVQTWYLSHGVGQNNEGGAGKWSYLRDRLPNCAFQASSNCLRSMELITSRM